MAKAELLLEPIGTEQEIGLGVRTGDQLQPDRQPVVGPAARDGQRRKAGHRDRRGDAEPVDDVLERLAIDAEHVAVRIGKGRHRGTDGHQDVVPVEQGKQLQIDPAAGTLRRVEVSGADVAPALDVPAQGFGQALAVLCHHRAELIEQQRAAQSLEGALDVAERKIDRRGLREDPPDLLHRAIEQATHRAVNQRETEIDADRDPEVRPVGGRKVGRLPGSVAVRDRIAVVAPGQRRQDQGGILDGAREDAVRDQVLP